MNSLTASFTNEGAGILNLLRSNQYFSNYMQLQDINNQ